MLMLMLRLVKSGALIAFHPQQMLWRCFLVERVPRQTSILAAFRAAITIVSAAGRARNGMDKAGLRRRPSYLELARPRFLWCTRQSGRQVRSLTALGR
jgi:hypothetical protein